MNKVILIGNVGADPTIRCFENGNQVAKFRLGTTERYKDKDGNKREITEWHNVEAWGIPAAIIDQYVRKGSQLSVEGQLHYEEYTDKSGVKKYQTIIRLRELELLTPKQNQEQTASPQPTPSAPAPQAQAQATQQQLQGMAEPPQIPLPPMQDPDDLPF